MHVQRNCMRYIIGLHPPKANEQMTDDNLKLHCYVVTFWSWTDSNLSLIDEDKP